jgi:hypothetical protein
VRKDSPWYRPDALRQNCRARVRLSEAIGMGEKKEFLANAVICREMSARASDPKEKDAWLRLAQKWERAAAALTKSAPRYHPRPGQASRSHG